MLEWARLLKKVFSEELLCEKPVFPKFAFASLTKLGRCNRETIELANNILIVMIVLPGLQGEQVTK